MKILQIIKNQTKWHPPWLSKYEILQPENSLHPHTSKESSELFLAINAGTTEIEVLNFLYALAIVLKPLKILETGAADGFGTLALASACKVNKRGKVYSVEIEEKLNIKSANNLKRKKLNKYAENITSDSRKYLQKTEHIFNLAFFDSLCEIRAEEVEICMDRKILNGPAVFHDTSPERTKTLKEWPSEKEHLKYREKIIYYSEKYFDGNYFESELSRGFIILFPKKYLI